MLLHYLNLQSVVGALQLIAESLAGPMYTAQFYFQHVCGLVIMCHVVTHNSTDLYMINESVNSFNAHQWNSTTTEATTSHTWSKHTINTGRQNHQLIQLSTRHFVVISASWPMTHHFHHRPFWTFKSALVCLWILRYLTKCRAIGQFVIFVVICFSNKISSKLHAFFKYGDNDFYPRDAMLARVIVIATCLSVHLSVRHASVLCQNEE